MKSLPQALATFRDEILESGREPIHDIMISNETADRNDSDE